LLFVTFTKKYSKKDDAFWKEMLRSYEFQLYHLITNLEYHWRFTNNHILNNARCLYLCGSILGIQYIKKIGREILLSQTDKMIKNGFLQEDSSHYQMLLTRSYLEILYTADISKDVGMLKWLQPRVGQMLTVCNMLQSRFQAKEYPLFGDISPDVFPEWMCGWPFSRDLNQISKWQKLFRMRNIDISSLTEKKTLQSSMDFSISRWYCISKGKFELWVIARVHASASHGHADNGSIVMFHNGDPIFIDPGRCDYVNNPNSLFQVSQEAHHTPIVDGIPIDSNFNSFLRFSWFGSRFTIMEIMKDYIKYQITSICKRLKLVREISLRKEAVIIEDTFHIKTSRSKITYNHYWCTCEKIDLFSNKAVIKMEAKFFEFAVTISDMFRSQSYGELKQYFQLGFSGKIKPKQKITSELRLLE
ncbi:MAG: heparinase II/III family protein, partial [Thermodesulfobacteriota bacterium]